MHSWSSYTDLKDDEGCSLVDLTINGYGELDECDRDNDHNGRLHICRLELALYLLKHGYDSDEDKDSILCAACEWGELSIVKTLVEQYKCDPTSKL